MKIWIVDMGWAGGLVAVAKDEETAIEILEKLYGYSIKGEELTSYPIKEGPIARFLGDS